MQCRDQCFLAHFQWFDTSRHSAGTALWSFGLEPAAAVSPIRADDPWCEEGERCRDGSGPLVRDH